MVTKNGPSELALEKFAASFEKSFGKGVFRISERKTNYDVISTGSVELDKAMGCGGYIVGRLTELWGPESGGKSTLAMIACGIAQKKYKNKFVAWIDVEGTWDAEWATAMGMDVSRTIVLTPKNAEDVADIMKEMLQSGFISVVVLDSIGAMLPEEEFEKDAGKASVGTIAKVITRMVKIAAVYAKKYEVAVLIINQVRANIGYGNPTTTGGGWALKHVTTHRLNVKRSGTPPFTAGTPPKDVQVGFELAVRVEKNKVAPPRRQAVFSFFNQTTAKYGPIGIDRAQECQTNWPLPTRAGGFYMLPNGEEVRGKDTLLEMLRANQTLVEEIRQLIVDSVADEVMSDLPAMELTEGDTE